MENHNSYPKILTDETLRETVSHGNEEYPFCYYLEDIFLFDFHCIDWHWHPELEFVYVKEGSATLLIGNSRYILTEGNGVFINTQIIHRFETGAHTIIPNIVFSPALLASENTLIYKKYVLPILRSSLDCQLLSPDIPWQKTALNALLSVFALQESEHPDELQTLRLLLRLWNELYEHLPVDEAAPVSKSDAYARAQLQIMMQYIHTHYPHRISLDDLAQTVTLSKSSVLHIFNRYLHTSPVSYLIHYRLKCAAKLLVTTESSISSIAQSTGFENTGYFCRKFKKGFHVTPSEYRKAQKEMLEGPASVLR